MYGSKMWQYRQWSYKQINQLGNLWRISDGTDFPTEHHVISVKSIGIYLHAFKFLLAITISKLSIETFLFRDVYTTRTLTQTSAITILSPFVFLEIQGREKRIGIWESEESNCFTSARPHRYKGISIRPARTHTHTVEFEYLDQPTRIYVAKTQSLPDGALIELKRRRRRCYGVFPASSSTLQYQDVKIRSRTADRYSSLRRRRTQIIFLLNYGNPETPAVEYCRIFEIAVG